MSTFSPLLISILGAAFGILSAMSNRKVLRTKFRNGLEACVDGALCEKPLKGNLMSPNPN